LGAFTRLSDFLFLFALECSLKLVDILCQFGLFALELGNSLALFFESLFEAFSFLVAYVAFLHGSKLTLDYSFLDVLLFITNSIFICFVILFYYLMLRLLYVSMIQIFT
jgi:hypothetical protein